MYSRWQAGREAGGGRAGGWAGALLLDFKKVSTTFSDAQVGPVFSGDFWA